MEIGSRGLQQVGCVSHDHTLFYKATIKQEFHF